LIPTIPADRVQEIAGLVNAQKKMQFINRLIAYWTLKRQYRNGVPLLRRLQTQSQGGGFSRGVDGSPDARELYQQLKYWQCLRQDLERARLLCELVRKREKVKLAFVKIQEQCFMMQLNPLEAALRKILDQLKTKDSLEIFLEPVDVNEVPDYRDVVTHPMDLGTMQLKLDSGLYQAFEEFEADFQLMIKNCLAYNNKDTIFYKSGMKMKDQGNVIFRAARKELEQSGLLEQQDLIAHSIDEDFKTLQKQQLTGPSESGVQQLQTLLDRANLLKHALARIKRVKMIKNEMARIKKVLLKSDVHRFSVSEKKRIISLLGINTFY
jgi:bromodomain and PHD finger-containing protein 1